MRVVAVEVENFGVFSGIHRLSLANDGEGSRSEKSLIVGHNGSGKTSIFRAIDLALYGPASLPGRISRQTYQDYLRGLVHKNPRPEGSHDSGLTRVSVDLEYTAHGRTELYRFERAWSRANPGGQPARVHLLTNDGDLAEPVDEERALQLLPLELRRLMLVDVAFVDELMLALQSPGALEQLLRELSGMRVVERLRSDLLTVNGHMKREVPRRQESELVQTWTQRVAEIGVSIELQRAEVEQLQIRVAEIERVIAVKERELFAAGGHIAKGRPALHDTLLATESELEQRMAEVRDLCQGTLPFALCPNLCLDLAEQLDREAVAVAGESLASAADEWLDDVSRGLMVDRLLAELVPGQGTREAVVDRLTCAARELLEERRHRVRRDPVHDLSAHDRRALLDWIEEAVHVIPRRARAMADVLDKLEGNRDATLRELDRVPDEEGLRATQSDLRGQREQLVEASSELMRAQARLDDAEAERLQLSARIRELEEDLARTMEVDRVAELVHRTRLALTDFEEAQLDQRAAQFGRALVATFNNLSRKQSLLAAADFDPVSRLFRMTDGQGQALEISKLSTGELQLYAMAVLESLTATTTSRHPLLVDTPLAYLDELHRDALLSTVLLGSNKQVVLFATDQEMDSRALEQWLPHLDHVYRLEFDSITRSSSVSPVTFAQLAGESNPGEVA